MSTGSFVGGLVGQIEDHRCLRASSEAWQETRFTCDDDQDQENIEAVLG